MKRSTAALGVAAVTTLVTSFAALAPAATAATASDPIATGLKGPLQMDVEGDRLVVAQNFTGKLTEINADGSKTLLATQEKGEVAGVAIDGDSVAFLSTKFGRKPASFLKVVDAAGEVDVIANLFKHESELNPDGDVTYGFTDLGPKCDKKVPKFYTYKGIVDSHPYGLAEAPGGGWFVADAAANAILHVTPDGAIDVVAVLPPQQHKVTKKQAEVEGLPPCAAGHEYGFEAVPTDVEVDDGGQLVVSLLPGGPEMDLGPRGSVVRLDLDTSVVEVLAAGFAGATNVAVNGEDVFVSELFGGRITEIAGDGTVSTFFEAKQPAAIEWVDGQMYAAIKVFNQNKGGSIVTITP